MFGTADSGGLQDSPEAPNRPLDEEAQLYLAAVEACREEGREPKWRPETRPFVCGGTTLTGLVS
jgi:hypothetical protein